jgi:hypothetical protein
LRKESYQKWKGWESQNLAFLDRKHFVKNTSVSGKNITPDTQEERQKTHKRKIREGRTNQHQVNKA